MSVARLSVVVVTDHFRTIRRVVARLREQTVREQLEVVIVAPSGRDVGLDEEALDGFAGVRVVEMETIHPMSLARAAGVRAASAPIVFLGETHSFPHPGFAEAIIAAHVEPWDIVVPGLGNENPENALSWASFLTDYGQWLAELPAGEIGGGPTWNVSYKRMALLDLGEALERVLSPGDELAVAFRAQGRRAWFEPAARLDHANVSRPGPWADERYLTGLLIAANRKERWSLARRWLYIFASPLIPVVILSRIARPVRLLARKRILPKGTVIALVVGAVIRTAGEVVGYMFGSNPSAEPRMEEYELHKLKFTAREV
jgi:hypothetical protein